MIYYTAFTIFRVNYKNFKSNTGPWLVTIAQLSNGPNPTTSPFSPIYFLSTYTAHQIEPSSPSHLSKISYQPRPPPPPWTHSNESMENKYKGTATNLRALILLGSLTSAFSLIKKKKGRTGTRIVDTNNRYEIHGDINVHHPNTTTTTFGCLACNWWCVDLSLHDMIRPTHVRSSFWFGISLGLVDK